MSGSNLVRHVLAESLDEQYDGRRDMQVHFRALPAMKRLLVQLKPCFLRIRRGFPWNNSPLLEFDHDHLNVE